MSKHSSSTPFFPNLLGLIVAAAAVSISTPLFAQTGSSKTASVETPVAAASTIAATVQWQRRVELSTPLIAAVTEVLVEAGETVKKGQVLLRLDARAVQAQAQKAQAELARLLITRDEAAQELRRAEVLYRRKLLSDHELQMVRIVAAGAEADFSSAQVVNTQAQLDLERSTLRAPFDGVVVQRLAEPGQMVVKPVTLLVVAETSRMRARAEVQREVLAKIKRGQTIKVIVADQTYSGIVKHIGLEPLDGLGGQFAQYELVVEFNPPASAGLYAGQPAQLSAQ